MTAEKTLDPAQLHNHSLDTFTPGVDSSIADGALAYRAELALLSESHPDCKRCNDRLAAIKSFLQRNDNDADDDGA